MVEDPYGLSRVVGEPGVLPQQAARLDPSLPARPGELLLDVEALNVDAASMRQLEGAHGRTPEAVGAAILAIVRARGKLHNPVTGSGGMLLGTVREAVPPRPDLAALAPGTRLATLVSLTLTPLHLDEVLGVELEADRVRVRGHALLFPSGLYAVLPADLPEALTLALLDVCGAPALVKRHARPGTRVLVLGAGKSGLLCLAQAKESGALTVATDVSPTALKQAASLGLADETVVIDASSAVATFEAVRQACRGALPELVVQCTSSPGAEMAAILCVADGGTVLFFSMATSFSAAALGAEGVGKDATLLIGNGYSPGHAALTLELVRRHPLLLAALRQRYVPQHR